MKETADKTQDSAKENFGSFTIRVDEVYDAQGWERVRSPLANHAVMCGCMVLHYQPSYSNETSGILAVGTLTQDRPVLIDIRRLTLAGETKLESLCFALPGLVDLLMDRHIAKVCCTSETMAYLWGASDRKPRPMFDASYLLASVYPCFFEDVERFIEEEVLHEVVAAKVSHLLLGSQLWPCSRESFDRWAVAEAQRRGITVEAGGFSQPSYRLREHCHNFSEHPRRMKLIPMRFMKGCVLSVKMVVLHAVNAKMCAADRLSDARSISHKILEGLAAASGRLPHLNMTLDLSLNTQQARPLARREWNVFRLQYGDVYSNGGVWRSSRGLGYGPGDEASKKKFDEASAQLQGPRKVRLVSALMVESAEEADEVEAPSENKCSQEVSISRDDPELEAVSDYDYASMTRHLKKAEGKGSTKKLSEHAQKLQDILDPIIERDGKAIKLLREHMRRNAMRREQEGQTPAPKGNAASTSGVEPNNNGADRNVAKRTNRTREQAEEIQDAFGALDQADSRLLMVRKFDSFWGYQNSKAVTDLAKRLSSARRMLVQAVDADAKDDYYSCQATYMARHAAAKVHDMYCSMQRQAGVGHDEGEPRPSTSRAAAADKQRFSGDGRASTHVEGDDVMLEEAPCDGAGAEPTREEREGRDGDNVERNTEEYARNPHPQMVRRHTGSKDDARDDLELAAHACERCGKNGHDEDEECRAIVDRQGDAAKECKYCSAEIVYVTDKRHLIGVCPALHHKCEVCGFRGHFSNVCLSATTRDWMMKFLQYSVLGWATGPNANGPWGGAYGFGFPDMVFSFRERRKIKACKDAMRVLSEHGKHPNVL